jgi:hypothetical protein
MGLSTEEEETILFFRKAGWEFVGDTKPGCGGSEAPKREAMGWQGRMDKSVRGSSVGVTWNLPAEEFMIPCDDDM